MHTQIRMTHTIPIKGQATRAALNQPVYSCIATAKFVLKKGRYRQKADTNRCLACPSTSLSLMNVFGAILVVYLSTA